MATNTFYLYNLIVMAVLRLTQSGKYLVLGKIWNQTKLVEKYKWFE